MPPLNRRPAIAGLIALVALIAVVPTGDAMPRPWSTSDPELTFGPYYIDNDACQPECIYSIWWYEETNGIEGLQRGDEVVDDTGRGAIESDTIIGIGYQSLDDVRTPELKVPG